MLINVTELRLLVLSLIDEYNEALSHGKKPCYIKVRIDCIVKALMRITGSTVNGKSSDVIVEVDI